MISLAMSLWLAIIPGGDPYAKAVLQLDEAIDVAGKSEPDKALRSLEKAIENMRTYPEELAADAETLAKLGDAWLSIVWLHLSLGDDERASEAMDEALRSARGVALPAGTYGPKVLRLYEDRRAALRDRGTATIDVDCRVPCQVIVDERRSANPTDPLYLGDYRVWVGARDGSAEWKYYDVSLDTADQHVTIVYQLAAAHGPERPESEPRRGEKGVSVEHSTRGVEPNTRRMLPRWAELLGMAAGLGLTISGGVLLALDGTCPGGADPTDLDACPFVRDNKIQGYALLGTGLGVFGIAGVLLTVDEVRVARGRAQQVMVHWTLRF